MPVVTEPKNAAAASAAPAPAGLFGEFKVLVKDVEVDAGKVLHYVANVQANTPKAVAALGVLLGAVSKGVASIQGAAAQPFNIQLDEQTAADIKAVWPDVVAFAATLGIKL